MKGDTRSLDYSSHVVWGLGSRDPLRVVWGLGFKGEFFKISIADFSKRRYSIVDYGCATQARFSAPMHLNNVQFFNLTA